MKSISSCALVTLALAWSGGAAAFAEPRESFNLVTINGNNPLIGTGLPGNAGNTLVTVNAVGSHIGTIYRVRHLVYSCTISAWGSGTSANQTGIRAVAPNGAAFDFQPFPSISTIAGSPAQAPAVFTGRVPLPPNTPTAGTWRFFPFDVVDNPGADVTYGRLTVTFDDADPVPPSFTELGFVGGGSAGNYPITLGSAGEIRWFRMSLGPLPATPSTPGYADFWLSPPGGVITGGDIFDTEMALFNAAGAQVAADDNDGPSFQAQLSFGSTVSRGVTTYFGLPDGSQLAGQDGPLTGGTYYLAVGAWDMGSSSGLNAYSNYNGTQRTTMLHIRVLPNPTNPTVTGLAMPSLVLPGASGTLLTATYMEGQYPFSTGLVITADLSSLGGVAAQQLYDDGTHGDLFAGDFIFSFAVAIPPAWPAGVYTLPTYIADEQGRTGSDSVQVHLATPPLGVIAGTDDNLGTEDVYTFIVNRPTHWDNLEAGVVWTGFRLLDAAADNGSPAVSTYLDIDTNGTAPPATTVGGLGDTEIGVYRADGTPIRSDDDSGVERNSALSFGDASPSRPLIGNASPRNGAAGNLAAGDYYVAVGLYETVFGASGFNATTTSPGAVNAILNFRTNLPAPPCSPADLGAQGGVAQRDDRLDNNDFIVFIDLFFATSGLADLGRQGGIAGADGQFDNNDFVIFIDQFFNGQGACGG